MGRWVLASFAKGVIAHFQFGTSVSYIVVCVRTCPLASVVNLLREAQDLLMSVGHRRVPRGAGGVCLSQEISMPSARRKSSVFSNAESGLGLRKMLSFQKIRNHSIPFEHRTS